MYHIQSVGYTCTCMYTGHIYIYTPCKIDVSLQYMYHVKGSRLTHMHKGRQYDCVFSNWKTTKILCSCKHASQDTCIANVTCISVRSYGITLCSQFDF